MNNLSWLIYLAGVVNSVGILAFIVGCGACGAFFAGLGVSTGEYYDDDEGARKRRFGYKMVKYSVAAFLACSLLLIVLPGRETIYAIAASEMGEELLNSETGSKAVKALDAWLDRQIADDSDDNSN